MYYVDVKFLLLISILWLWMILMLGKVRWYRYTYIYTVSLYRYYIQCIKYIHIYKYKIKRKHVYFFNFLASDPARLQKQLTPVFYHLPTYWPTYVVRETKVTFFTGQNFGNHSISLLKCSDMYFLFLFVCVHMCHC